MRQFIYKIILLIIVIFNYYSLSYANTLKNQKDSISYMSLINFNASNDYEKYLKFKDINQDSCFFYAIEFSKKTDTSAYDNLIADVNKYISHYYEDKLFLYNEAIEYQNKALNTYSLLDLDYYICECDAVLARLNIKLGNYHIAFNHANKGLKIAHEIKHEICERECYLSLELIYFFYYKNVEKSKELNIKVSNNSSNKQEDYQRVKALNNRFNYPTDIQGVDSIIKQSYDICTKNKFLDLMEQTYLNASVVYTLNNKFDKAKEYLNKSEKLIQNFRDSGYFYSSLGLYHTQRYEFDEAIKYLNLSKKILNRGDFEKTNLVTLYYLQAIYSIQKDYENAFKSFKEYYSIYTKLNNSNIIVDLSKSLNEIQLAKANERFALQRDKQTFIIISLILTIIILILGLLMFVNKRKLEKKSNLLLQEKTNEIIKSKDDLIKIKRLQQYQENTFIDMIISNLGDINKKAHSEELKSDIYTLIRQLNSSKDKSDWTEVEKSLEMFDTTFYNNLIKEFPDLTTNERKLCTFIHMNMSTKEISNITHQSVGSINTARSRLRKRFNISGDDKSLISFLDKFN